MKKYWILAISLLISSITYSIDISGDIKGIYTIDDSEGSLNKSEARIFFSYSDIDYFSEFGLIANSDGVDLYRAYTELYRDALTISIGRQMIVWGNSYIFNGANQIFNPINIANPKADNKGIDSLRLRYNLDDFSRSELIIFDNNIDNNNYAMRHTFTAMDFEFMINYFSYKQREDFRSNDFIFEFKGDLKAGLWGQYILQDVKDGKNSNIVLGSDYSFDTDGKLLYTLGELLFNLDEKESAFYLRYDYSPNEYITLFQAALLANDSNFITTGIKYLYNDDIDMQVTYNYWDISNQGLIPDKRKNELSFEVKVYF